MLQQPQKRVNTDDTAKKKESNENRQKKGQKKKTRFEKFVFFRCPDLDQPGRPPLPPRKRAKKKPPTRGLSENRASIWETGSGCSEAPRNRRSVTGPIDRQATRLYNQVVSKCWRGSHPHQPESDKRKYHKLTCRNRCYLYSTTSQGLLQVDLQR